ncbi:MAG: ABC transporter permease [Tannerella sp.]|jgi:putative ABC transport system permease protein|nr:ABC transporter permease [Tannerella sp.]
MKQFFRNFNKQRTVGVLNICSLSLGIMVAVIVGLWTINELSFDSFHKNKERIYRVVLHATLSGNPASLPSTFRPLGEEAKATLPAIENMCRVFTQYDDIHVDNVLYRGVKTFMADSTFFTFFTFNLLEGDPQQVLSAPDRVVISRSAIAKYFPEGKNPIGKMIKYQGKDFAVSGIMQDMPKNSSMQTDFVFPFFDYWATQSWGNNDGYMTFFLLHDGVTPQSMEEPLTQIAYNGFELFKNFGATYTLESLNDMHFSSGAMFDPMIKGNKSLVMTFVLTALVILLISCINFANLFVSTSFLRAKAIGIRKTVGAKRGWLMRDFYVETAGYVLISIALGLVAAHLTMPVFNNFTQASVSLDFGSPQLYIFLAVLLMAVVLLAGSFPALYMTKFNPLETIKGKFRGKKMSFLQKGLVITQFTASITLLIVVAFMQKQIDYILAYDLGFDKEHVLFVQDNQKFDLDYRTLEGEFLTEPSITGVTRKNALPTQWNNGGSIKKVPEDGTMPILMEMCYVSPNYFDFFDMKIVDGENPFFLESSADTDVMINESAARMLGYEHPVGEFIDADGQKVKRYTIKGVVRNAHTKSLRQAVDPQVYFKLTDAMSYNLISFFKVSGDSQRAISFIEKKWKEKESEYPFIYQYLDDTYKQLYTSEMNAGRVFGFAMLIALIITVAGLFAMAFYATQRRVREIAIRKVYGASIRDIFILLNKSFMLWVVISFAIACPVAWYVLQKWLGSFTVKTSLSLWIFLMVGLIALCVTLFTTGYQTWKAATGNPARTVMNTD